MKTTLDLNDSLLIEAKLLAVQRKSTLKALVESALRRELHLQTAQDLPSSEFLEQGPLGLLRLKKRADGKKTSMEDVRALEKQIDDEEFRPSLGEAAS